MKNFLFLFISLFALHSCTLNSEITYHKDAATTTMMDLDMKDAMSMMKSMMPDSAKNDKKEFAELEKLPKTWTSLYDMEKKEGKLKTKNPDSIKIMKKIFMKSSIENNEISGFSFKMDHFSKDDYNSVKNISKNEQVPIDQMAMNDWDGKTLTIDTEKLSLNGMKDLLAKKGITGDDESPEMPMGTLKMMYKKIGTTLKFENKIKSITGKHDWLTKVDDHSIRIDYDLDYLFGEEKDKKPLKNADKKIVVVTE
ncbi:hypothetical protein SAMN05421664_1849 [Chryseobacterium soldanellicola]|uniref:Lipoprotein n=1 Tax=Chryseobacterium soldanellicola TaxID=311333 RepID=A0A1H1BFB4_9FLAO|nr:hypothetical protein [Chryseobacterium soldanellicola]SDQ50665.1 hypothetical protein SAMN05421664_1849 [Chryseobacterium soldanellicola]